MLTAVLAIIVTLGLLIVVHEYGHYRAALSCRVKVLRFSVGFGPVLWKRQRGDTEFVISALPLGGYVKMLDEREGAVPPAELDRAFNRKPVWQRAVIVLAGPLANLALAVLLYAVVSWVGVPELKPVIAGPQAGSVAAQAGLQSGDWIQSASVDGQNWTEVRSMSDLRWQVMRAVIDKRPLHLLVSAQDANGRPQAARPLRMELANTDLELDVKVLEHSGIRGPYAPAIVAEVMPDGPAAKAGLQSGDLILALNDQPVTDSVGLIAAIRQSVQQGQAQPLTLRLQRGEHVQTLTVVPVIVREQDSEVAKIHAGIGTRPQSVTVRYGFIEGWAQGFTKTWDMSAVTLQMMGRMLIGQASLKNISGPITMADYAGRSAQMGWVYFVGFLAFVSLSLGVLNLLPIPVLDGGHLMYYLFEGITGRPVSELWQERLQRGGLAILILMMSLALFNDLARQLGQL